jgi:tellurite resistance protein
MMERGRQLVLQAAANMAWADNQLDPREIEVLRALAEDLEVPGGWEGWLNAPPAPVDLDRLLFHLPGVSDQNDFLTILLATSLADDQVSQNEHDLLLRVSSYFGLDPTTFADLSLPEAA